MVKYVLRGFTDANLTLPVSAYCFHILCKENPAFIAPFALELVQQILVPQFVAIWNTQDKFADIMRGFGLLIPQTCQQNHESCGALLMAVIQPLLIPINA